MIPAPRTEANNEMAWQAVLRDAIRSVTELAAMLRLPPEALATGPAPMKQFPLLVPRGFAARMRPGDPADPLLRQVLPDARETDAVAGFDNDPLRESAFANEGIVRKYHARALVVTTGACPVHCRYCFRRAFPYAEHNAASGGWARALDGLRAFPDATEVILSGGDPLSLSDRKLAALIDGIVATGQFDTLRIHTRFPIMIPERITPQLTHMLLQAPLKTVLVVHANHPNEIDSEVAAALERLKICCTALLNQSVLLRGVNDDIAALVALSRRLFECGVLPYYLHMLDRVSGAAHFLVTDDRASALLEEMRRQLPGYLVPKLVREIPGRLSKTPVI